MPHPVPVDDRSDLVVCVEVAVFAVLPGAGHHVVPLEVELARAVLVGEHPELVHERAAADVVPVGVDVDLPREESRLGPHRDLLAELLVERHLAAKGAVRARGLERVRWSFEFSDS